MIFMASDAEGTDRAASPASQPAHAATRRQQGSGVERAGGHEGTCLHGAWRGCVCCAVRGVIALRELALGVKALGSNPGLESDETVRVAAYGYPPTRAPMTTQGPARTETTETGTATSRSAGASVVSEGSSGR